MKVTFGRDHKSPYVEPYASVELASSEINLALQLALMVDKKLDARGVEEQHYEHTKELPSDKITRYRIARFFTGNLSEIAFKKATGYLVRLDASGNDDGGYDAEVPAGRINIKTRFLPWRDDTTPMLILRGSDWRPDSQWFFHSKTYHSKDRKFAVVDFYGGISQIDARGTANRFDPKNGRPACSAIEAHRLIPWPAFLERLAIPEGPRPGELFEYIEPAA